GRRAWVRYPGWADEGFQILERTPERRWWAPLNDCSRGGVRLILPCRIPPGLLLLLELPAVESQQPPTVLMRVVHATGDMHRGWLIGCEFRRALSEDELRKLLQPEQR